MATFEQALDAAFEITFRHGQEVDATRANLEDADEHMRDLLLASTEQTFIGSLDVLGTLLRMAGRIPVFEISLHDSTDGWMDGSSAALRAMMTWARDNGKITEAEYLAWMSIGSVNSAPIGQ